MDINNFNDLFSKYGDHLTAHELAEYLGICNNTVYILLKTRKIKGRRVGSKWIITRTNIIKFLNNE